MKVQLEKDRHDKQQHSRKLFIIEGIFVSAASHSFLGDLSTAYALELGSSQRQIGILTSFRRFAGFTQLFTNHLLERLGSKRRLYYCVFGAYHAVVLLVSILPTFALIFNLPDVVWWLISLMFITSCAESIGIVLKKTWMSEITPSDIRGRYFGLRNLLLGFSGLSVGYLSSLYVDHWREAGKAMYGFQSLFMVSALFGFSTLVIITLMPDSTEEPRKQNLKAFLSSFQIPFRDKPYVVWMAFNGLYNFAVGFAGPFFTVYLLKELQLPLATVAIYTAIGEIASIALSRYWGALADKYGNKTILVVACIAKSIFPILWVFAIRTDTFWAVIWLGFVHTVRGFNSAQNVTVLNMALWLSPKESRPMYLACESTIVNLFSAISPLLGGMLLGNMEGKHVDISIMGWKHSLSAIHILFIISAILRGMSSLILLWVKSDTRLKTQDSRHET